DRHRTNSNPPRHLPTVAWRKNLKANFFAHRLGNVPPQPPIQLGGLATDGGVKLLRGSLCAHMQYHPRAAVVTAGRRVVEVDERLRRGSRSALKADFGDADYLKFSLAICQPLTYRVNGGEPLPGRRLVNDRNGRLSRVVSDREVAPAQQADFRRSEIARRDDDLIYRRNFSGVGRPLAGDGQRPCPAVTNYVCVRYARRFDAGQGAHALQQSAVKVTGAGFVITEESRIEGHGLYTLRFKLLIKFLPLRERPHKKPGAQ